MLDSVFCFPELVHSMMDQTLEVCAKRKLQSYSKNSVMYFRLHLDHIQGLV
jgi:hypothetical protein